VVRFLQARLAADAFHVSEQPEERKEQDGCVVEVHWEPDAAAFAPHPSIARDLYEVAVRVAEVERRHRSKRAQAGHRPLD
jgi:hypothetical protein